MWVRGCLSSFPFSLQRSERKRITILDGADVGRYDTYLHTFTYYYHYYDALEKEMFGISL